LIQRQYVDIVFGMMREIAEGGGLLKDFGNLFRRIN